MKNDIVLRSLRKEIIPHVIISFMSEVYKTQFPFHLECFIMTYMTIIKWKSNHVTLRNV